MKMNPLLAPMQGAEHLDINGVQADIVKAGLGRIKRMIYPPGTRWDTHLKHLVSTDLCMHAHVGFLAQGHLQFRFSDGLIVDCIAPQVVVIEPGHDAWVVGDEAAVLIEFDFEKDTVKCFGLSETHCHG
jgi:hypothetical protein